MSWDASQRTIATPTGATVTGTLAAGGAQVHIDVTFRTIEWPWKENGPVSLIPQPAETRARTARGELLLGLAIPSPHDVVTPARHSSTASVRYNLHLTTPALAALESSRDGRSLEFVITLVAHPYFVYRDSACREGILVNKTSDAYTFKVPTEEWLEVLRNVGFCETLVTELRLPTSGPESTAQGRQRLAQAVAARNDGGYAEAMRRCRIALNELGNAGFGGKAPKDVVSFFKEKAGTLTQTERYSALKVALELYLHPAAHANAPEEHYTREDADLAVAMTSALLRIAATRGGAGDGE